MQWIGDGLFVLIGLMLGWCVIPKPALVGSLWAYSTAEAKLLAEQAADEVRTMFERPPK